MMPLEGKVALITGAGKGAGRAAAVLLARQGARVAANDISPVNLDGLVRENEGNIRAYPEDIAKKVGVQTVLKLVEDELGPIDILVNHAAVEPHVPLLDMDEWDWHRVLDVNLTGAFLAIQSAGRIMRQRRSGLIFNLVCLQRPERLPRAAYDASMLGLIELTRAAAQELGPLGIFVHAIGHGLAAWQDCDPEVPGDLEGAMLYLCRAKRNGQVVNLEA
jgi:NAD(P)-dependent dehydrogenase (short-subunit alcohol dehydrogenase family)